MKAISLWEPWASAIARGLKQIETRPWATIYRGPLAICAARTKLHAGFLHDASAAPYFAKVGLTIEHTLPFGCVVAVVDLKVICRTEDLSATISEQEKVFGNYAPGRFGWMLGNVIRLRQPVPFRGKQGFFEVPDELILPQLPRSPYLGRVTPFAEQMLGALRRLSKERTPHECGGFTTDDMQWQMGRAFTPDDVLTDALAELEDARLIRFAGFDDHDAIGTCYELGPESEGYFRNANLSDREGGAS